MKSEVRDIAFKKNLVTADKKDSVGICFVGEKNLKDFLNRFIEFKKGNIKDENNNVIGQHQGAILYTQGQRQGLMIGGVKGKQELPWYVYKKDILNNEIYVCQGGDNELLMNKGLYVEDINFINEINYQYPISCSVQVRHQHTPVKCIIEKLSNEIKVTFSEPIRAIAPGQSAVFYDSEICLGGGVICKTF
jgi:tRNA-specific 2-thiouridylase